MRENCRGNFVLYVFLFSVQKNAFSFLWNCNGNVLRIESRFSYSLDKTEFNLKDCIKTGSLQDCVSYLLFDIDCILNHVLSCNGYY